MWGSWRREPPGGAPSTWSRPKGGGRRRSPPRRAGPAPRARAQCALGSCGRPPVPEVEAAVDRSVGGSFPDAPETPSGRGQGQWGGSVIGSPTREDDSALERRSQLTGSQGLPLSCGGLQPFTRRTPPGSEGGCTPVCPGSAEADLGVGGGDEAGPLLRWLGLVQPGGDAAGQQLLDGLAPQGGAEPHVAVPGQQLQQLFLLHGPGENVAASGQAWPPAGCPRRAPALAANIRVRTRNVSAPSCYLCWVGPIPSPTHWNHGVPTGPQ